MALTCFHSKKELPSPDEKHAYPAHAQLSPTALLSVKKKKQTNNIFCLYTGMIRQNQWISTLRTPYPQMARDADVDLKFARVELFAVCEDANDVAPQPTGAAVVRASSEASRHGSEVDRPPHFHGISMRELVMRQSKGGGGGGF